jgi:putative ABC transport system ATP-binding protein
MGPLFGLPRSATARARSPVRLAGYTVREFRELPDGVARLATLVGARVANGPAGAGGLEARDRRVRPLRAKRE